MITTEFLCIENKIKTHKEKGDVNAEKIQYFPFSKFIYNPCLSILHFCSYQSIEFYSINKGSVERLQANK